MNATNLGEARHMLNNIVKYIVLIKRVTLRFPFS